MLRVLLGSCLEHLTRTEPESGAVPITFFIDEMPRLGRMEIVEMALDVGRGYGVRLWMFVQNMGQLRKSYQNASGMVGNCFARCYIRPDNETAAWISEHLGQREGLFDGSKQPLAAAHELTGPDYANNVIVMLHGMSDARLTKRPAYEDPECLERMRPPLAAE